MFKGAQSFLARPAPDIQFIGPNRSKISSSQPSTSTSHDTSSSVGLAQDNEDLRRELQCHRTRVRKLTNVLHTKASTQMLRIVGPGCGRKIRSKTVSTEQLCRDFKELRELSRNMSEAATLSGVLQDQRRAIHAVQGSATRVARAKRRDHRQLQLIEGKNRALVEENKQLREELRLQARLVKSQKEHLKGNVERQHKISKAVELLIAESSSGATSLSDPVNFCGLRLRPSSAIANPSFVPTTRGSHDTVFKSALVALIKENDASKKHLRQAEAARQSAEQQLRVLAEKFETLKRAHRDADDCFVGGSTYECSFDENLGNTTTDSVASQRISARMLTRRSTCVGSALSGALRSNAVSCTSEHGASREVQSSQLACGEVNSKASDGEADMHTASIERNFTEATAALKAIRELPDSAGTDNIDSHDDEFAAIVFEDMKGSWKMASELALQLQHVLAAAYFMSKQSLNMDEACVAIMEAAVKACNADRGALFVVDKVRQQLWSKTTLGGVEIRVPFKQGVVGFVAAAGESVHIPDAYSSQKFDSRIDRATGYRTRNILAVPVKDPGGEILGVLQLLNKVVSPLNDWKAKRKPDRKLDHMSFSVVDEMVLGMIARQAGVILQSINTNAEALSKHNKLESLLELLPQLHTDFNTSDHASELAFVEKLERSCVKLLGATRAVVFVCVKDESGSSMIWTRQLSHPLQAAADSESAASSTISGVDGGRRFFALTPKSSLAEQVVSSCESISLRNAYSSPYFNGNIDIADYGHLLCSPILIGRDECVGCVEVLLPKVFGSNVEIVESAVVESKSMLRRLLAQAAPIFCTMNSSRAARSTCL